jgi:hypothetical protein
VRHRALFPKPPTLPSPIPPLTRPPQARNLLSAKRPGASCVTTRAGAAISLAGPGDLAGLSWGAGAPGPAGASSAAAADDSDDDGYGYGRRTGGGGGGAGRGGAAAAASPQGASPQGVEWLVISGSSSQVEHEVRALAGAPCATATAAAAAGRRLGDAGARQWQLHGGCAGRGEPAASLHEVAASAMRPHEAAAGAQQQTHLRHEPSGLWLPLAWVMQLAGAAQDDLAAARGATQTAATTRSREVEMEDVQAAVEALRSAPEYFDMLEKAVAMEIDFVEGYSSGDSSGSSSLTGQLSAPHADHHHDHDDHHQQQQEQQGKSGPAPHPLSTHPHAGGLVVPRVLLVVDTNILLEAKGWAGGGRGVG